MEKRTIEKILSGEHSFVADKNPNASKEAIAILRYALYDICELSEDELSHILCKKLLIKLGLYKYYLAIESPLSSVEIKKAYVRNKICPNVFPYDEDELYRKVYISSLKDNKVKTVFCRFHNVRMCLIAMRCVLDMIFDTDDVTEYAYFADSHKEEMEDLFKLFKLDDFYESFCESTETSEEDNLSGAGGTGYLDDKYITDPENDTIIMNNALGDNASYDNYDKDVTVTIRTMIEPGFDKAKYIGGVSAEFWSIDGKYGMTYEADISSEKLWNAVTDGTWEASDYYYLPQGSWQFKLYKLEAYQSKDSEIVCYQNEIKDARMGESYTICCLLGEPEWVENKKDTVIPEAYVNMGNVLLEDSVMKQRQNDLDMMRDQYGLLMAENANDMDYFLNTLLTSNDKVRIYSPSHPDDIYSLSGKYYKVYAKWEWKPESGADKKTKYLRSEFDKAVPEGTKDSVTNLDKEFVKFCNDNKIDMSTGEQSDKDVTGTNNSYANDADKVVTNDKKQYKTIDAEKDKTGKDYIIMTIIVSGLIILVILAIKHKIDKGSISDE